MLDNHNVRISRVDMFRVVVTFCPTKVIRIVELCKKKEEKVKGLVVYKLTTHTPSLSVFFLIIIIYIYIIIISSSITHPPLLKRFINY